MNVLDRIDGVVIGVLIGFEKDVPLVVYVGNPTDTAMPARSLAELDKTNLGSEVALLFESGDPSRPLIVGPIVSPLARRQRVEVLRDGESVRITGKERVELRCGLASIVLEKDGRIAIRGTQVSSQASGTNRVKGGAVHIN